MQIPSNCFWMINTVVFWLAVQALTYIEFFAGAGEVFTAIRGDSHPGCAVDVSYLSGSGHAMDINSDSGLPFHCCIQLNWTLSWKDQTWAYFSYIGDRYIIYICLFLYSDLYSMIWCHLMHGYVPATQVIYSHSQGLLFISYWTRRRTISFASLLHAVQAGYTSTQALPVGAGCCPKDAPIWTMCWTPTRWYQGSWALIHACHISTYIWNHAYIYIYSTRVFVKWCEVSSGNMFASHKHH